MTQYVFNTEKIEDCRSGISQIVSNIDVCSKISDFLSTTLGPYGLDKLFYGSRTLITNDGATILENMRFNHPVAKMLASLSKSQDIQVGDGTTSVVLLTSAILNCLKPLVKEKYDIGLIRSAMSRLRVECVNMLESLKIEYDEEKLCKLAETCMTSKNIRNDRSHFAKLLITALKLDEDLHINKINGASLSDSYLVDGIAFEKTFTYAGYDQQPRKIKNPKVCCINIELEWKSEKDNAEIRIDGVDEYQNVVDAEWTIIKEKLDDIIHSGANVVLSSQPVGDYATQYFARHNIFSAGRVPNLDKLTRAFKGRISNSTKYLDLGSCDLFEERQLGKIRYNYFEGKTARSRTLILRGPGEDVLNEVERSLHDAICVIKTSLKHRNIVTGGGSVEMELSRRCRDLSMSCDDESIFVYRAISKAFESIPAQLAKNFGLDPIMTLQKLRKAHTQSPYAGISKLDIHDMAALGVFEPLEVKKNMIKSSFNAVESILMINSTIISKK